VVSKFTSGQAAVPRGAGVMLSTGFQVRVQEQWARKAFKAGTVELTGALFAACQADQTAAAGTPATNNLSAFTYSVIDQLDTSISLNALCARAVARLQALNMSQTPVVDVPPDQPQLGTSTFITMQAAGDAGTAVPPTPAQPTPAATNTFADILNQIFGQQPAGA
jgi:hypothetical protein